MDILTPSQLLQLSDPEWLIGRLFPRESLVVLYGPAGHGKSFVALDWACHVAAGQSWQTRPVAQGPVVYIAAEGRGGLPQRLKAWLEAFYEGKEGLPIYFGLQPLAMLADGPDELLEQLEGWVDEELGPSGLYPQLIIVDTLARCFAGGDENETADMGRFVESADQLRQSTGATVLVLHHTGKDEEREERGSSVLRGAADTLIRLKRDKGMIHLTCRKQKDAIEFPEFSCQLREQGESCVVGPGRLSREDALAYVQQITGVSRQTQAREMAKLTGMEPEACRKALERAS